jgi:single-strand DNA-binding protein
MASLNKVQIIGHLGRDPELRYMASGAAVANVSVATTSKRKDKHTGETIEDTQWHRVTFYERLAEVANEYLHTGSSVYIEGRIKYGKFTDKNGVEKNTVDIIATDLQFLGGIKQDPKPEAKPEQKTPAGSTGSGFDDMDSDIPF